MASGKKTGKKSQASNDFLQPQSPTSVTATDVGTSRAFNNGAASVSFSLPGSSPAATSFTVTSSPGSFTATGASSPLTVTGLQSNTAYTFTVTATNALGTSAPSSASASITATTVPATPSAPSASTSGSSAQDNVSWTAPANGGKAITGYTWSSSDGKSGSTGSTSVTVNQEAGTAQTYAVYATNANGNSLVSANSASVTTFSFTPFSFVPYSFVPYSFVPYGFTPFAFYPFGFTPVPFSFAPFGFAPTKSLGPETLVLTTNGLTAAANIRVGDTLVSVELSGLPQNASFEEMKSWSSDDLNFSLSETLTTTVTHVATSVVNVSVIVNGELYSGTHYMLTKRDGVIKMIPTRDLLVSDELWSADTNFWTPIDLLIIKEISHEIISINCEPYDMFFTDKFLVYDGYQVETP